jgi:hypothetical protein
MGDSSMHRSSDGRSAAVQGSGPVDKQIKHADRQSLIPWRPKLWWAPDLIRNVAALAYVGILLFELVAKVHPDGLLNAAIAGMVLNTWKQYTINPSVAGNMQSNLENGWKNVFR